MASYLVRRLLGVAPVLLAAATLVWILLFLIPGDPARLLAGARGLDPDVLQSIRAEWGLDDPAPVQYARYLGRLVRGDLGTSYVQGRPVSAVLRDHIVPTVVLAAAAVLLSAGGGLLLGSLAAYRRGRVLDALLLGVALVGSSAPVFWLGLLLILFFASFLRWLPVLGYGMEGTMIPVLGVRLPEWDHLVLPALTLALVSMGSIARVTRATLAEADGQAFLVTASAKGQGRLRVFVRHALRNALIPVVTVVGLNMGSLLGGAVATEFVFAWPGLGKALVRAIALKDLPVVEGCVLTLTLFFVLVNLVVDLLYPVLDPRIQYGSAG
jgi:peptide/nickel transport system permease protein